MGEETAPYGVASRELIGFKAAITAGVVSAPLPPWTYWYRRKGTLTTEGGFGGPMGRMIFLGVSMQNTLAIGGMTCAACSARIERVVRKLEGVVNATVNLATEKLFVEYEAPLELRAIKEAVTNIGYQIIDKAVAVDEDKLRKEKAVKVLWTKFIVARTQST